jgi:PKHD-type hydroxylase
MRVPEVQATVSVQRLTDENSRKSHLRWLTWNTETDWIYQKIGQAVTLLNERIFGFDLTGIQDLQFTEYRAPGGFYGLHQDMGEAPTSTRKLSLTVQLSEPTDYEGSELEVFQLGQTVPKTRGTVTAFAAWEFHQVHPVTAGVRRSLVAWCEGPMFR